MNLFMKVFSGKKREPLSGVEVFAAYLAAHWRSFVIVAIPLLFLPLALLEGKEGKCGYVICIMALYWMTEALPLPVTSLIPIVLFPLFGILSSEEVCALYFKETNVMFVGAIIMAIAVEHCNLHKRIAMKVLLTVGTSPQRLMLGFMVTTMFLSMWICNAGATAMMTPIVVAVLQELKSHEKIRKEKRERSIRHSEVTVVTAEDGAQMPREIDPKAKKSEENEISNEEIGYFLGIAYAANIGGTGTVTGTATNLTFKGIFESIFPKADGINFATWMEFNVPLMVFNTFLAWTWLQIICMGLFRRNRSKNLDKDKNGRVRNLILESYNKLGPFTYHEGCVLLLFILDVLLWFFRKPEFIPGWGSLFPEKVIKDGSAAIAVAILLFVLPANTNFIGFDKSGKEKSPSLLDWKTLQQKFPFGIILLLGGGFAISKASEVSGLSKYMGTQLEVAKDFSPIFILIMIVLATTFATEVCSNTAVANILLPVLARMCRSIRLHPMYLMMPATVSCSYAFMLPVATPPNAIVVAASNMKTSQMMKAGIGMNLICATSLIVCFILIGVPIYGFESFPDWAEKENVTSFMR